MTHTAKAIAKKKAASPLLVMLALFAFLLQTTLVQTHIHGQPDAAPVQIAQLDTPDAPGGLDPLSPTNCTLCQEMARGSVFVAPIIAILPVQLAWVAFLPVLSIQHRAETAHGFGWQSRAPPHA